MENEILALEKNNTWEVINKPPNSEVIDCRWVYKIKSKSDGSEKYKARLVARGFTQIYGENYWETYAPVVKCSTIRLLLASAVEKGMIVEQVDVRNAYIKSELNEIIYMKQPPGFNGDNGKVLKLKKSLYGLKQSGHQWNKCINGFLVDNLNFVRLESDPCVYKNEKCNLIISMYVDDILIFAKDESKVKWFKNELNAKFEIEDIGECKKIIGIEVEQSGRTIRIHQETAINELIQKYGMEECNPRKSPMEPGLDLHCPHKNCDSCELVESTYYRGIVGKLLFIAGTTRPDISFAVSYLSRFLQKPHNMHLVAAQHVIRYLKGTKKLGITYKSNELKLYGHSDADWGSCKIDRRSCTGFMVFLAGGPIAWEARKQPTVALSTTEAEYMAITSAARELQFCGTLLQELNLNELCQYPIELYSDNLGAIKLSENTGFSSRTKHIDIRHHFIRELIKKGVIVLKHVNTNEMIADVLTKSLGYNKHLMNITKIMS